MKRTKILIIAPALLTLAGLASCNPGSGPTPEKKIIGYKVDLRDTSKKYYFGDSIEKNDFKVIVSYSDGTSEELTNFKVYYDLFMKKEVTFPYAIEYDFLKTDETFTININNGTFASTISVDVEKKYNFEYGDPSNNIMKLDNYSSANAVVNSIKDLSGVKYYSSNANVTINKNTGTLNATNLDGTKGKDFTEISAKYNGVCIDKYRLVHLDKLTTDMTFNNNTISLDGSVDPKTYDPNGDGFIILPDIHGNNYMTAIAENAFKECAKIARVTIPTTIDKVGVGAFHDCSLLERVTFERTDGWYYVDTEGEHPISESIMLQGIKMAQYLKDATLNFSLIRK